TLEPAFAHDIVAKKHSPLEACKSYQSPVLLIHGEEDAAVPAEGSRVFYQAYGGPKEFHRLAGADHGFSRHVSQLKEKIIAWLRAQG
ncbi:prolyl oligopeptidase family serine peptidase, partial [Frankia sp. Cpl3]|nr:prolyl oligopeptidase family serine peptidase [Frankia sp. Cpl3]